MNHEQLTVLQGLRHDGYAVILWTPEELQGVSPNQVQDRSIELGQEVIDCLREENNDGQIICSNLEN